MNCLETFDLVTLNIVVRMIEELSLTGMELESKMLVTMPYPARPLRRRASPDQAADTAFQKPLRANVIAMMPEPAGNGFAGSGMTEQAERNEQP